VALLTRSDGLQMPLLWNLQIKIKDIINMGILAINRKKENWMKIDTAMRDNLEDKDKIHQQMMSTGLAH
jgi:hypothetical protein